MVLANKFQLTHKSRVYVFEKFGEYYHARLIGCREFGGKLEKDFIIMQMNKNVWTDYRPMIMEEHIKKMKDYGELLGV